MKSKVGYAVLSVILLFALLCPFSLAVDAREQDGLLYVEAELSCYINAMGGVEFGAPLLQSASVNMGDGGQGTVTLHLGKSQVEIYSVVCDTFVDVSPALVDETAPIPNGTLGYYAEDGRLMTEGLSYTLSADTAKNARDEDVHYVDSITFPVNRETDTYHLTLYINSNVMGTQFAKDGYPAILTLDWLTLTTDPSSIMGKGEEEEDDSSKAELQPDSMDGLNIYHADDKTQSAQDTDRASDGNPYTVYLNRPLLIITLCIALLLVVIGIIVSIAGRRDGKHEK